MLTGPDGGGLDHQKAQDLAAGSAVPTDSFITATVPKLTDGW